jgi:F0F1-type ATP synthase membrane subunit c/vacuolar-type H+-ATPase subunit K
MKQQRIMVSATIITTIASLITGYLVGKYTSQQVKSTSQKPNAMAFNLYDH